MYEFLCSHQILCLVYALILFVVNLVLVVKVPYYAPNSEEPVLVQFLGLIFCVEYAIYKKTKDTINGLGIIILFILQLWFTWPIKILMLVIFIVSFLWYFVAYGVTTAYKWLFKKRDKKEQ